MQGYSIILVIVSTALKYLFLYFSEKYAGLTSMSKQTRFIILPIFLLSFIMYAIVPVLSTWDMRGTLVPLEMENIFTTGVYSDFNSTWFSDVGKIVYGTMTFNIIMPIVDYAVGYLKRYALRVWDQGSLIPGKYE